MKKNTSCISIAIVDDHELFVKGLCYVMDSDDNINVHLTAKNGIDLISKLDTQTSLPDVCLLDINMPVMDGYQTIDHLSKHYPDIKVLVLSMFTNKLSVIRMMLKGASGFVSKDIDVAELKAAIGRVCENGYYYQGAVADYLPHGIVNIKNDIANITDREMVFLKYCCTGMSYADIGREMSVSGRTIENYRDSIFKKLNVHNRVALTVLAIQAGLISGEENLLIA